MDLVHTIEEGKINSSNTTERTRILVNDFRFDRDEAKSIWSQGPENCGPNYLVNSMKGVQCPKEVRDSLNAGFQWATQEGPLCEERMIGVQFNLMDLVAHGDPAHRKASHIIPMARRAFLGAAITAKPAIVEPIYEVRRLAN